MNKYQSVSYLTQIFKNPISNSSHWKYLRLLKNKWMKKKLSQVLRYFI